MRLLPNLYLLSFVHKSFSFVVLACLSLSLVPPHQKIVNFQFRFVGCFFFFCPLLQHQLHVFLSPVFFFSLDFDLFFQHFFLLNSSLIVSVSFFSTVFIFPFEFIHTNIYNLASRFQANKWLLFSILNVSTISNFLGVVVAAAAAAAVVVI